MDATTDADEMPEPAGGGPMRHLAHLYTHKGRLSFSGYLASGDPSHRPFALVVDVGRLFSVTWDEPCVLFFKLRPDDRTNVEFSAEALATAARAGLFGFRVVGGSEGKAIAADRARRARSKLDRRARIAAETETAR